MLFAIGQVLEVPAALVVSVSEGSLSILARADLPNNPYTRGETAPLQSGLYCETVMATRAKLHVPDALADPNWKNNPDVALHLISYLGLPLLWPDGEIFGTICVLDSKPRIFSQVQCDLFAEARARVEENLAHLLQLHELTNQANQREFQIREIHHRIKNHFNFLIGSLALQDQSSDVPAILSAFESRVMALSLLHEKLHRSAILESMDLGEYLGDLCRRVVENSLFPNAGVHIVADSFDVIPAISVPCGLLMNELVTNSLKHAFAAVAQPAIFMELRRTSEGQVALDYRDNGPGAPVSFKNQESTTPDSEKEDPGESLGGLLIREFTRELHGSLSFPLGDGFRFRVVFPCKEATC